MKKKITKTCIFASEQVELFVKSVAFVGVNILGFSGIIENGYITHSVIAELDQREKAEAYILNISKMKVAYQPTIIEKGGKLHITCAIKIPQN